MGKMHIFYVLILPRSCTTPYCQPACCLFCLERQNSSPTTSGMRPIPSHHTSPAGRNSTHTLNLSSTSNAKPRAWTPTTPPPQGAHEGLGPNLRDSSCRRPPQLSSVIKNPGNRVNNTQHFSCRNTQSA